MEIEANPGRIISIRRFDVSGNIDPEASFSLRDSDAHQIRQYPGGSLRILGNEFSVHTSGPHMIVYEPTTISSPIDPV